MPKTQEWIARENISRFRQMIAESASETDRAQLEKLLVEEEDKLEDAEQRRRDDGRR